MIRGLKQLKRKGYTYMGWRLGETVIYNGRRHRIIGFSIGDYNDFIAIDSKGCSYPINESHRDVIYIKNKSNTFLWVSGDYISRKESNIIKNIKKLLTKLKS